MEEQPGERHHYPRYHQHPRHHQNHLQHHPQQAGAPGPGGVGGVNHEVLVQLQETQAEKTGSRRLTAVEVEKFPACPAHLSSSNGSRHVINSTQKPPPSHISTPPPLATGRAAELRKQPSMDPPKHRDKAPEWNQAEAKHPVVPLPNGLSSGLLTNGYSGTNRQVADGPSDAGYTGQRKTKARGANARNVEHGIRETERDARAPTPGSNPANKGPACGPEGLRTAPRGEGPPVDPQRRNGEGKTVAVFGRKPEERHKGGKRSSSPSKEDSWTLFRPPPVFPVDNSSAKIVPKISYASKVKENLNNKEAVAAAVAPPPVRLSQVPMSAMKTFSSVSFTNGPLPGNGHPLGGPYLAPAGPQALGFPAGDNVASCPSPLDASSEPKKCAMLIYPLNMQPVLPSARPPHDPHANQNALGDIFQNQWGLSFINEPGLGAEGRDKAAAAAAAAEPVTFFPDSKRTCVPPSGKVSAFGPPPVAGREDEDKPALRGPEKTRADPKGHAAAVQAREGRAKVGPSSLPTLTFGSSKDRSPPAGLERRSSWGAFDVRAAVAYHTKEIEYVFNLQKQDPKRVVVYEESKDTPNL